MNQDSRSRRPQSWGCAVATFVAAVLVVLMTIPFARVASAKDNPEKFTRVYQHSYDEVWEAAIEAVERKGLSAVDRDKDKGTITGTGKYEGHPGPGQTRYVQMDFEIFIESVNPKPETRMTIREIHTKGFLSGTYRGSFADGLLAEVQKVLATYK